MRRLAVVAALCGACAPIWMGVARAQFGRGVGDWSTTGGDAQRSSWVRSDVKISRESLQKPGFQLVWKVKLNNEARQLNALTPAALLTGYIGYRGFRSLGFVSGSGGRIFALDTDLGRIEWQKPLKAATSPQGSLACPGGMTANVSRQVSAELPPNPSGGRGMGGRARPATSGVGEPGEGSVVLKEIAARGDAGGFRGAPPARGRAAGPARGPAGGFRRMPNYLHAVSSDGMFHSMYVSNGEEPEPAVKFLPPNANVLGLIVVDNVAYAATSGACGGVPNAVWALDTASKQVATWQPPGGAIAGSDGPAFGPDGTLYVATQSGDLVALEAKTLKVKDVHRAGREFSSSPVVFQYKEKSLIAAATRDGRIYVVDSEVFGKPGYLSPVFVPGGDFNPGALASWQDTAGTRFVLAATANAVVAWKMVEQNGAPALEPAWTSPDLASPLTPFIINGVVFAASSGEFRTSDTRMTALEQAQRSSPAVVHALDGSTGKSLWNSGKTIASFVHNGGLSGGGTQVYLGTHDGTLYAFGFPIEH